MIRVAYQEPVAELFKIDMDRTAVFTLVTALRHYRQEFETSEYLDAMIEDISSLYTGDLPGDHPAIDGGLATT